VQFAFLNGKMHHKTQLATQRRKKMIQAARMPYVRFETEVVTTKDNDGHNQFSNKIMAYITSAGSKDEVVKVADEWIAQLLDKAQTRGAFDSAANEYTQWYERFSKLLQNYKNGLELDHDGTPIRASMAFSPAEVAQCESVKIFTLEALATCNEEAMSLMGMGGRALKQKAAQILEGNVNGRLAEENSALKVKIEELSKRVEQLSALVVEEKEVKKRGRKPASEE
jgi:hypothetical protein